MEDDLFPIVTAEATQTIFDLVHRPDLWYNHIRRYSTAIILASVFGLRGASFESLRVKALYHVQDQQTRINEIGGAPAVDALPILKWLPDRFVPWRVWAKSIHREYRSMLFALVEDSIQNSKKPDAPDCFLAKMLREQEKNKLDEEHAAYLAGTFIEAGSDTTASTLLFFLQAMATHPRVLEACQSEVDRICGTQRLPEAGDLPNLPYIKAVMNEIFRWRPVAPAGVPHATSADDEYLGFHIPKGTMVFANAWSIHRTDEYRNPDSFWPERYLDNELGTITGQAGSQGFW
ncbi:Cytochrome P450-like protein 10 [Elsinoe fawcettii]|nr:Cytochrome P450-like protein 10 [Elsinoe fawcettii]